MDRKRLIEYMKGKGELNVDEIDKNAGVNHLRLHTLLFEEEMEGCIVVVQRSQWGAPERVYWVENNKE